LKLAQFYPGEIGKNIAKITLQGRNHSHTTSLETLVAVENLSDYSYSTKEEARNNNGFYCSRFEDLDFSQAIIGEEGINLSGLRFGTKTVVIGACYKDPNIINKKTIKLYFYPKVFFEEDSENGITLETIITLEFTKNLFITKKETIDGKE
jgi:hypothetical protein